MFEIAIIKQKNVEVVDSLLLYKVLEVKSRHADWIRRRIDGYGFIEGNDYFLNQHSTLRGGTNRKEYLVSLDMAKELCMLENNDKGKATRRYFIKAEKAFRRQDAFRLSGIEIRKGLTDLVYQSGEDERMHGRGFSTYTLMIYRITGLANRYKMYKYKNKTGKGFRDTLDPEELKRVENAEAIAKSLLDIGKKYDEIKDTLKPLFTVKELS